MGWIAPIQTFAVTEKVAPKIQKVLPSELEQINPWLKEGDLENHDGETELIADGGFDEIPSSGE